MPATPGPDDGPFRKSAKERVREEKRKAIGRQRSRQIPVDAPPRDPATEPTTHDRFERRLGRLSHTVEHTSLGDSGVAFDFELFRPPVGHEALNSIMNGTVRKVYGERLGGASTKSVVVVTSTGGGHPIIPEFVIRLDAPSTSRFPETPEGRRRAVFAVRDLVAEVGPPTADTGVWRRPSAEERPFGFATGPAKRFLDQTHPHIGDRGVSVHPTTFLDFLADLLDAYPGELD